MLGRLAILAAVLAVGLGPTGAAAAPRDVASTHTYLVAGYAALHATVANMRVVAANVNKLNRKFSAECPRIGVGSPQNEESQHMSFEVAGALWSTAYHTDAGTVQAFVRAVKPLRWSNSKITRIAQSYIKSLHELTVLPLPDLCGDVRAWSANGFRTIPASTLQFDKHLETIEGKPIPPHLIDPYVQPADKALAARDEHLLTQLEHMETMLGQDWWDMTLETLALNQ
jgi:hypothetical protein